MSGHVMRSGSKFLIPFALSASFALPGQSNFQPAPIISFSTHEILVRDIVISADQKRILVRGLNNGSVDVQVWDLEAKKRLHTVDGPHLFPQFSSSGSSLFSMKAKFSDKTLAGWEVREADFKSGTIKSVHAVDSPE